MYWIVLVFLGFCYASLTDQSGWPQSAAVRVRCVKGAELGIQDARLRAQDGRHLSQTDLSEERPPADHHLSVRPPAGSPPAGRPEAQRWLQEMEEGYGICKTYCEYENRNVTLETLERDCLRRLPFGYPFYMEWSKRYEFDDWCLVYDEEDTARGWIFELNNISLPRPELVKRANLNFFYLECVSKVFILTDMEPFPYTKDARQLADSRAAFQGVRLASKSAGLDDASKSAGGDDASKSAGVSVGSDGTSNVFESWTPSLTNTCYADRVPAYSQALGVYQGLTYGSDGLRRHANVTTAVVTNWGYREGPWRLGFLNGTDVSHSPFCPNNDFEPGTVPTLDIHQGAWVRNLDLCSTIHDCQTCQTTRACSWCITDKYRFVCTDSCLAPFRVKTCQPRNANR